MIWVTGDQHYNHENMIRFCNRPFRNVNHMNESLIYNHNERIDINDTVYVIGDFRFSDARLPLPKLLKYLNGNLVFIKGNHDRNNGLKNAAEFVVIHTFGYRFLLMHKPEDAILTAEKLGDIDIILHAHVHDTWKFKDNMVNVGVDVWNYYPVHIKQLLKAKETYEYDRDNSESRNANNG